MTRPSRQGVPFERTTAAAAAVFVLATVVSAGVFVWRLETTAGPVVETVPGWERLPRLDGETLRRVRRFQANARAALGAGSHEAVFERGLWVTERAPRMGYAWLFLAFASERLAEREGPEGRYAALTARRAWTELLDLARLAESEVERNTPAPNRQGLMEIEELHYLGGWALRGLGEREAAEVYFRRYAESAIPSVLKFRRGIDFYNAACYAALAGQREEALRYWHATILAGYTNDPGWIAADPDLDPIRDEPLFRALAMFLNARLRSLGLPPLPDAGPV